MILLDTHVLVWWQAGGDKLSERASTAIDNADTTLVSPISFWEVGMLVEKERIALDRDPFVWCSDLVGADEVAIAPLTPTAALAAAFLGSEGFAGDPADSMLYATARELDVPLVSKDTRIREHARAARDLRVVW